MKKTTKLRLFGGVALILILMLTAAFIVQGVNALYLTFWLGVGYEFFVVRPVAKAEALQRGSLTQGGARAE